MLLGSIIIDIIMNETFERDEALFFDLVYKIERVLELFRSARSFLLESLPVLRHVPLFDVIRNPCACRQ